MIQPGTWRLGFQAKPRRHAAHHRSYSLSCDTHPRLPSLSLVVWLMLVLLSDECLLSFSTRRHISLIATNLRSPPPPLPLPSARLRPPLDTFAPVASHAPTPPIPHTPGAAGPDNLSCSGSVRGTRGWRRSEGSGCASHVFPTTNEKRGAILWCGRVPYRVHSSQSVATVFGSRSDTARSCRFIPHHQRHHTSSSGTFLINVSAHCRHDKMNATTVQDGAASFAQAASSGKRRKLRVAIVTGELERSQS